jgi:hypothetical protein
MAKFREVYEDLNTNVFVGCCDCGGGMGNVSFVDTLPETGESGILYVVNSPFSLNIWNGTGYDTISGGGGIESIVAGNDIEVDATDPSNPEVGVVPHTFLRLSGTEAGFPITGDIQIDVTEGERVLRAINATDSLGGVLFADSGEISITSSDGITANTTRFRLNGAVTSDSADSDSITLLNAFVGLGRLKKRFWTKAGTPDANDDANAGFINGSLLFDTTNSILYKCLVATAGAAVWVVYYDPRKFTKLVSVVDSAAVTGTTANSLLRWVLIPANTFAAGDSISITSRLRKTGSNNTFTHRYYQNIAANISGANILGTFTSASAGQLYQQMNREVVIKSETVSEVVPPTANLSIDEAQQNGTMAQYNIDWTIDQYIGFYVQLNNGSDSVVQSYYSIEKITNIP